jgi:hypothetical protein
LQSGQVRLTWNGAADSVRPGKLVVLQLLGQFRDQDHISENLYSYIQAFSPAVRDLFERFDFYTQVERLGKSGLLYMVAEKFAVDKDARFGCKGKNKYWFGYKRHVSVDMTHGLINKVDVTSAEKPDGDCIDLVCPDGGMVFADKGYCGSKVAEELAKNKCHSGVIKRDNMRGKDFRRDKWLTGVRMPFEGVFSKLRKKTRYRGLVKQRWQVLFEAIVHNAKRLIVIETTPLEYAS